MKENINLEFKTFEPKKENRFIINIGEPFNIPEYVIKATSRPSIKTTNAGYRWEKMIFEMYDPISPSTSQAIMNGLEKLKKQDCQDITITINLVDPVGTSIEKWKVIGNIDLIDFGRLDFNSDEQLTIKLYFNVHYAILI